VCNIVKGTQGAKGPYHDGDVVAGIKLFFPLQHQWQVNQPLSFAQMHLNN